MSPASEHCFKTPRGQGVSTALYPADSNNHAKLGKRAILTKVRHWSLCIRKRNQLAVPPCPRYLRVCVARQDHWLADAAGASSAMKHDRKTTNQLASALTTVRCGLQRCQRKVEDLRY